MAVAGVIIGALKTALKNAAKKAILNNVDGIAVEGLKKLVAGQITDANAVLLNRLKSASSGALKTYVSRETGLPISELNSLMKTFNQTQKMSEIAKGVKFKELARSKLKTNLRTKHNDSIKDIIRKIKEENARDRDNPDKDTIRNAEVLALLTDIGNELSRKSSGVTIHNRPLSFKTNVKKYYKSSKDYKNQHVVGLEAVLKNIILDLERYVVGSGEHLIIIQNDEGKWEVYNHKDIRAYVVSVKNDVKKVLRL